ncbi:chaperonin 10-like protein [Xylogone sp. PMI_703]|nr:chaperonin 10-like protein [Xylogone sp. PMI_703]
MSSIQRAIVCQGPKLAKLVHDRPIPRLRDNYILVKTVAVALNPADWKSIDYISKEPGALIGCDYAGTVEKVGPLVTKQFQKGDRVCGFAHGCNVLQHEDGAFAEYIVVKGDIQIQIPPNLSFEEGATLGVGLTTIGQGLYQALELAWPTQPLTQPETILIYGGSSATGILGIQFAKLSGYKVITTCSPHNFELVKSLGADEVFDYKDADCGEKINRLTNNSLRLAWDTISTSDSAKIVAEALTSKDSARCAMISKAEFPRDDIQPALTMAYTAVGEDKLIGGYSLPASKEHFEAEKKIMELGRELIASGKIRVQPPKLIGGLENVLDGIQMLRENKVSGGKLVAII